MVAKGSIRRAIGVFKDQTRISIAKVASNLDPFLDILIVKATSHDDIVPNQELFDEILRRSWLSKQLVSECVGLISKRIERTHDWIVALKCLVLVHRLMANGGDAFMQEIALANASHVNGYGMLSNMCVFKDEAHTHSWDYTEFVRNYGMYLDEKVEWMIFDDMWLRRRRLLRVSDGLNTKLSDDVSTRRVLCRMGQLQRLLERVLAMRPRCVNKHRDLVVLALGPVVEESFKLYSDICEGLSFLLDLFWGMEYWNIVKSLGTYVTVAKQIDELVEFYDWCKEFGVVTALQFPAVETISDDLLSKMEKFMKTKASNLKSTENNNNKMKKNEAQERSSPMFGLEAISENLADQFQDLIDLKEDEELEGAHSAQCENSGLPLLLLCDGKVNLTNDNVNQWKDGIESESKCDYQANTDWELALIESASTLTNKKLELGGGFDELLLESLYNQNPASKNALCSQMISGGNGVVVLQNPFAQEVETSQDMQGQNLVVWEQHGTNGIQGPIHNDVSSCYAHGPQAMVPYEMSEKSGSPGEHQYNNPWSD